CKNKKVKVDIDRLLEIDKKKRESLKELESLRAEENRLSYLISKERDSTKRDELIRKAQEIKIEARDYERFLKEITPEFNKLMLQIPNLPLDEVPIGKDERDNVVIKKWGKIPKFKFKPKDYLELAEKLDLIDIKRAAKVSGTRFGYLKKEAVLIEFALINFAFDFLIKKDFIPVIPPVMMKSEMMRGMGYIEQTDIEEAYYLPKDDLFLAGTAEQPIGAMHADEIFEEKDLPKRYLGFSSCFRREAGSYGKDTKGILRVHQFDKIEMFSFCHPQKSKEEHQNFLKIEEELMKLLKLPYQVVEICSGDMAFPTAAQYDIETWIPSQGRYRETHSTSNCTDYQARRLNIRYRDKNGKLNFVHTVNGTAFAIGRTLIAIIENYQQKDGSIKVPKALQKYLKFKVIK
ncbi:MAG: serine--tRNA ligase, partial [Patescibacteria group bacterium]|nr:serine--tRNA ligase [Patescibacteria group bacterium]